MGPKQGPGICQSFVDETFGDVADVFVDDFHVGNDTFPEHVKDVGSLLQTWKKAWRPVEIKEEPMGAS